MVSVLFLSFLICLAVGVPVAFSLGIASCLYFVGSMTAAAPIRISASNAAANSHVL